MNRLRLFAAPLLLAYAAIASAAPPGNVISLFDGKTLEGWDFDPKIWRVADGMITGGSTTEKITENHFICTKKSYQNFELNLKIKVSGDPATGMLNSGIQIRSVRVPGGAHMSGYQVDCGKGWFGKIYDEFRRNKVIAEPVDAAALEKAVDVYGWNEYRIRAEGPRIQTWINGVLAIDYTEPDKNIAHDGLIGPQVHSGGVCLVQVKDVMIEELPATPNAPTWESLGGVEAARKLVAPPPKPKPKPVPDASATKPKRDTSYNNVQGTPRSAGEQQKLFKLPPGFEIELVVQESEGIGKFVSVYFDQRGRMWTQTALEYPVDANENPAAAEAVYAGKGRDKVLVYPRESVNAPIPAGGLTHPTVFADGLAIPLGILPWGNGDTCYIQHGHDLKLFKDTDGDGKADTHEVILTGFGVQDSHLFPHQFTRAPGGWIWMAQGLFNNSKVHKPGSDQVVDWTKCSMARMRPDGSQFEVTSTGPNNIWGLVITGEGETFIQEANDYGYPVMPFHEYAYYPGGMEALKKSYQPDFPPTAEFRMGGTGLSGLALGEGGFRKLAPTLKPDGHCMFVANPIISKVQTLAMHRDGPYWKLEQAADLITCDDPFFRPVALTNGPDGCIYIVDWYNKIISHNEVPRAHPDRDKTRGRIWRVKEGSAGVSPVPSNAAALRGRDSHAPLPIPDFSKLNTDELIALLGSEPVGRAHLVWQTLADRIGPPHLGPENDKIRSLMNSSSALYAAIAQAWWVYGSELFSSGVNQDATGPDTHSTFRFKFITSIGRRLAREAKTQQPETIANLLTFAKPSLANGPTTLSSRTPKQIPVREAYDREFERFLVRMFLERHPDVVAKFLESEAAAQLPAEARMLASLALPPKASAPLVAKLLGELKRPPNDEEILRLAEGLGDSAVNESLAAALKNPDSRQNIAAALLRLRTNLDANKLAPLLQPTARELLDGNEASQDLALQLAGEFQFAELEAPIIALLKNWLGNTAVSAVGVTGVSPVTSASSHGRDAHDTHRRDACVTALRALGLMGSKQTELFAKLVTTEKDSLIRNEALIALASSKSADAGSRVLALWKDLDNPGRRLAMDRLCTTKPGARAVVAALKDKTLKADDLDAAALDRLQAVLGPKDPEFASAINDLSALFRPVLRLDGGRDTYAESGVTLDGPFTVETWVRLDPDIGNEDGILGSPGQLDMNFFAGQFRVWVGGPTRDAIVAKKKMAPDNWTHIAVTRDAKGLFRIYIDGELDQDVSKPVPQKFENVRIGWAQPTKGTQGMLSEFRIWNRVRSPEQIRNNFDRGIASGVGILPAPSSAGILPAEHGQNAREHSNQAECPIYLGTANNWGKLHGKARIVKISDLPPLVTPEEARKLDEKFVKYRDLATKQDGDPAKGKLIASLCLGCHLIQGQGGNLAPNISGAGTMGVEGLLRNMLTPNAAMEAGYRTFRVELKTGDIVDAFLVNEDRDAFIVRLPGLPDRRIPNSEVRSAKFIRRSLMPEGMLDAMQPEMVTDLFAYLMSLKG